MADAIDRITRFFLDPDIMAQVFPQLLREGLRNTVLLSFSAMGIGLVMGMFLALARISRHWWLNLPARIYIDIFRGLPAILTIFLVGIGMPIAGFRPFGRNTFAYAILALGLISTAYVGEIFRAGIQSVDKGQMEAARSVGMSYLKAMWIVIIPQGVRRVFPPLTNEFIALTKDSSLVFILGLSAGSYELYRVGQIVTQRTGNNSALVLAGLFYLVITVPLTYLVNWMDTRLREGKQVAPAAEESPRAAEVPGGHGHGGGGGMT